VTRRKLNSEVLRGIDSSSLSVFQSQRLIGIHSGVPGELRGLEELHRRYGVLSWYDVLEPSVALARDGFKVSQDTIMYEKVASTLGGNFLINDDCWAMDFAPQGELLGLGQTMTRKRFASTLETIAKFGADAFYNGAIADSFVQTLKDNGGIMTTADLASYKVKYRQPLTVEYKGYKITSASAPSSGAVALGILKTLEGYQGLGNENQLNLTTHRLDESIRYGYGRVR